MKLPLYARHGIWLADPDRSRVKVYRSPDRDLGRYESLLYVERNGFLDVAALPGVAVPVSAIFG